MTDPTHDYVGVHDGDFVYVIVAERSKFDRIARPVTVHANGCTSKFVEADGVRIIFQHWAGSDKASEVRS